MTAGEKIHALRAASTAMEEKISLCESLTFKSLVLLNNVTEMNGKLKADNIMLNSIAKSLREHRASNYPQPKQMHSAQGWIQGQGPAGPVQQTQQQHQQRRSGYRHQINKQQRRSECRQQTYQQHQQPHVSYEATYQQHPQPGTSHELLQNPSMPCTQNRQAMIRQHRLLQMAPEVRAPSDVQPMWHPLNPLMTPNTSAPVSMASTAATMSSAASTTGTESVAADDNEWEACD